MVSASEMGEVKGTGRDRALASLFDNNGEFSISKAVEIEGLTRVGDEEVSK